MDSIVFYLIGILSGIFIYSYDAISVIMIMALFLFIFLIRKNTKSVLFLFLGLAVVFFDTFIINTGNVYDVGENIKIHGEVVKAYEKKDDYQRIEVKSFEDKSKISVFLIGYDEVNLYDEVYGDVKICEINSTKNFNIMSSKDYYFKNDIKNNAKAINLTIKPTNSRIKKFKLRETSRIKNILKSELSDRNYAVMAKLILADSSALDEETEEIYSENGVLHLLAISGLHIYIIIYILENILKSLHMGYNLRFLVVMFILFSYAFLINFPASVDRAILMYFLRKIFDLKKIKVPNLEIVLLSMAFFLTIKPKYIFNIGFQLSFGSVIGISILNDKILPSWNDEIKGAIKMYIIVNMALFPILIYYFNNFNFISLLSNLFFAPIITVVLVLGYLGIIFYPISKILFFVIDELLTFSQFYLELAIDLFKLNFRMKFPSVLFVIFYYLILFVFFNEDFKRFFKKNYKIVLLNLAIFQILSFPISEPLYLGFYDVSNGDSAYLLYKDLYIQIDTGGNNFGDYNYGEKVTCKAINLRGIEKIDLLILSHLDFDHIGGAKKLIEKNLAENIVINDYKDIDDEKYSIIRDNPNVNIINPHENQKLKIDDKLSIEFMNTKVDKSRTSNDTSLITLVDFSGKKILFLGDLSSNYEDLFIRKIGNIDILKVSHHGSEYSTDNAFLKIAKPKISVISVGKNSYGHPSERVLSDLNKSGSKILRTDEEGEILFKIDENIDYMTYENRAVFDIDYMNIFISVIIILLSIYYMRLEEEIYAIRKIY